VLNETCKAIMDRLKELRGTRGAQRGQLTIIGIIFLLVSLVVFVGLQPVLNDLVSTAIPVSDTLTAAVLRLLVPLVVIGIMVGFLVYVVPQRQGL
jgi:uncharacterized BrkB/YihY/UPF0761 family membrane protein